MRTLFFVACGVLVLAAACTDAPSRTEPTERLEPGEEAAYFSWPRRSTLPADATERVVRSALTFLELEDEVDSVLFVGEFDDGGQLVLGIGTDGIDGPYLQLAARAEGTNWAGFPQAAPAFSGKRALALHAFHGRTGTVVVLVDPGVDEGPTSGGDLRFRRVEDGVYVARSLTPPGGVRVREEGDTILLDSFGFGVEQEGPDPSVTPGSVVEFSPPPGD